MIIISADDIGRSCSATDNIVACHRQGLITSSSVMVFMRDSERAAELIRASHLETGLHINFTLAFDSPLLLAPLKNAQFSVINYLRSRKWNKIIYNPLLGKKFEYLFKAQYDEYLRLFSKDPAHIDGHHHMHLCMNMILGRIVPRGLCVRRGFSFSPGEKGLVPWLYRRLIDHWLVRNYRCTDYFFGLGSPHDHQRLAKIMNLASSSIVELMVHPDKSATYDFLMSRPYRDLIANVPKGTYRMLPPRAGRS